MRLFKRPNQIEPTRAAALLERGQVVVLDVRETIEWKAGRIPGRCTSPSRTSPLDGASFPVIRRSSPSAAAATAAALQPAGCDTPAPASRTSMAA